LFNFKQYYFDDNKTNFVDIRIPLEFNLIAKLNLKCFSDNKSLLTLKTLTH